MIARFRRLSRQARAGSPRLDRSDALRTVALVIAGYLLGGLSGALIAGMASVIGGYEPRLVALFALLGVVLTGVLSVIEQSLHGGTAISNFVSQHPEAAQAGRLSGIIFLAAIVCLWTEERAKRQSPDFMESTELPQSSRLRMRWSQAFVPIAVFSLGVTLTINLAGDRTLRWVTLPIAILVSAVGALARRERGGGN